MTDVSTPIPFYTMTTVYRNRRFALLVVMTLLGVAAGFIWGQELGYQQGKADTFKAIQDRLNAPNQRELFYKKVILNGSDDW